MAKSAQQKIKLLYLMKLFMERSDEAHPLRMQDIMDYLQEYGISIERKTVYDDIEQLRIFGMDIVSRREQPAGYYLTSRMFEVPELKLLVDAVQSSKFITPKKSRQLIKKLESLASVHEAKTLQRQVFVENRVKAMNEGIYYNIDTVHNAISADNQITFQYYEWTLSKEMKLKRNGARYRVSPWGLIWKDDNYYVIGLDEKSKIVKHYRVDKMMHIKIEKQSRNGGEIFSEVNVAQFAARNFGMFGGREEVLVMEFENRFVGVVIDHFGQDVTIRPLTAKRFEVTVQVHISGQFFGWLAGLGEGVVITAPDRVRKEYKRFLRRAMSPYERRST